MPEAMGVQMDNSNYAGMPPMMRDAGGNMNLFGDMTIIHTQQFNPPNPMTEMMRGINHQMQMINQRMMQQQQVMIEQQKIDLENRRLSLAEKAIDAGFNPQQTMKLENPKEKVAMLQNKDFNIDDAIEVDVKSIEESKQEEIPIEYEVIDEDKSKYDFSNNNYIDLSKYFDVNGEVNSILKQELIGIQEKSPVFKGEGGDKPVLLFLRYSEDKEGITDFWRNKFRLAMHRYTTSVFKRAGFITDKTTFVVFVFDSAFSKIDIIHIRPVPFSIFNKVKAKEQIENYSASKDFYNWIMDNNELVKNKRINSVQIVAEPDLRGIETSNNTLIHFNTYNPNSHLNEIVKNSLFENKKYSIDIKDLLDKSYIVM